jgi:hypothetical protein
MAGMAVRAAPAGAMRISAGMTVIIQIMAPASEASVPRPKGIRVRPRRGLDGWATPGGALPLLTGTKVPFGQDLRP